MKEPRAIFFKQIMRKVFLEDGLLKLVALVITFALWLGVTGLSTPITKRLTVPLNFNIANDAEITNSPIQEVEIVISGDKRKIEQINRTGLAATVDLTDTPAGARVLSLSPENVFVPLPPGIKLDEVQPGRIAVRLEAVDEKEVNVRAVITGSPKAGFEIYDEVVTPPTVRVRGPASFVKTLESAQTDRLDVSGASEDVTVRQVPISVSNDLSAVLNTVVDVTIRIGEKRVEKTFQTAAAGRKVVVILFGPRSAIEAITSDELKPEIVKSDDGTETPRLVLDDSLTDKIEVRSVKIRGQ